MTTHLLCSLLQLASQDAPPPNILFIIADDLRPELGCYGADHIVSPNIDRLAARGTVYRRAYCNIPVSGASRASLLTGLYPDLPGRFSSFDAWAQKDAPEAVPLPKWFRDKGYYAISNGKVFHNLGDHYDAWSEEPWRYHPEGYGKDWADYNKWELWLNDESADGINPSTGRGPFCERAELPDSLYDDGRIALKTVADLRRMKHEGKPFFMAVGFWRPHLPFNAPARYWDIYERNDIEPATNRTRPENLPRQVRGSGEIKGYGRVGDTTSDDFHRQARHGYYASVSFIDAQIGMILDELEALDMTRNTIVVLLGDHGWHLGEHEFWGKHNLMHLSTNSPLIISVPSREPSVEMAVTEFVDIYPTLCDFAGIPQPGHLEGRSFAHGHQPAKNARIQWGKGINIISSRYNYAAWPGENGYTEMLFDHENDPAEDKNVAGSASYRNVVERFRQEILSLESRKTKPDQNL